MKASCPVCTSRYPIPNEKIQGKTKGLPVRCRHCGAVFRVYDDGRPPSLQNPPDQSPWADTWRQEEEKLPRHEAAGKPSVIGRMEPAARESGVKKRVVRSTIINQPPPDLGVVPLVSLDQLIKERRAALSKTSRKTEAVSNVEPPSEIAVAKEDAPPEMPRPEKSSGFSEDARRDEAVAELRRPSVSELPETRPPKQEAVDTPSSVPELTAPTTGESTEAPIAEKKSVLPAETLAEEESESLPAEPVIEEKSETQPAEPAKEDISKVPPTEPVAEQSLSKTPSRKRKTKKKAKPKEAAEEQSAASSAQPVAEPLSVAPPVVEEETPDAGARKRKVKKKAENIVGLPQVELPFPFAQAAAEKVVSGSLIERAEAALPPFDEAADETPEAPAGPPDESTDRRARSTESLPGPAQAAEEALAAMALKAEPWKSEEERAAISLGEDAESFRQELPPPEPEAAAPAAETKPSRRIVHMGIADDFHDPELEELRRMREAAKAAAAEQPKRISFWERLRGKSTRPRKIIVPEAAGYESQRKEVSEEPEPTLSPSEQMEKDIIPSVEPAEETKEPLLPRPTNDAMIEPEPETVTPKPESVTPEPATVMPEPATVTPESSAIIKAEPMALTTPQPPFSPLDWEPDLPPEAYDDLTLEAMGVKRPAPMKTEAEASESRVAPKEKLGEELPATLEKEPEPTPLAEAVPQSSTAPESWPEEEEERWPELSEEIPEEESAEEIGETQDQTDGQPAEDEFSDEFLKVRRFGDPKRLAVIAGLAVLGIMLIVVLAKVVGKFKSAEVEQPTPVAASTPVEPQPKKHDPERFTQALEAAKPGGAENYRHAVKLLDEVLAVDPEYTPAIGAKAYCLALLAIDHQQTEGVPEACELAERAVNLDAKAPMALRAKAACLLASDRLAEAEKMVQQAIAAQTDDELADAESYFLLSLVYQRRQAEDKALAMANTAIEHNPLHIQAYHQKSRLHAKRKEWSEAKLAEQKALVQLDENLADNRPAVAMFKENIAEYQKMIEKHRAQTTLTADATAGGNTYDEKKKLSDQLLAKLWEAETPREALTITDELLVLGIYTGRANLKKCELLNNLSRYREAIQVCTAATSFSSKAYWHLGGAYEQLDDQEKKKQSWETYLKMAPNGPYAAEIRRLLGG